jgi:hypothetical protein
MMRVILESPYGMDPQRFIPYGRACVAHSLSLEEAPMAMHLLYTQPGVLDDTDPMQRERGMEAAFSWYAAASAVVVYRDFGISTGMQRGILYGESLGLRIDYRSLRGISTSKAILDPFPAALVATVIEPPPRRD